MPCLIWSQRWREGEREYQLPHPLNSPSFWPLLPPLGTNFFLSPAFRFCKIQMAMKSYMYLPWVEGHFVCASSVNFRLMRETAGMRLRRFAKKKKQENNSGSSTWDNFSCHISLCNLDGSGKVFRLLCGVWKEVVFKKRLNKWSRVLSYDCLGDRCR